MWSLKLLSAISKLFPSAPIDDARVNALELLNPDRIDVENVRSILNLTQAEAFAVCERAVSQGLFGKAVEVRCPDDAVAAIAASEEELPGTVYCWEQGENGHLEEVEIPTKDLRKAVFYTLNE